MSYINNNSLRISKNDIINFNVDMIEVFGTLKNYQEILKGIDDENSNYRCFKGYTLEKTDNLRNYQYKITFWKNNTPVFAWYLGNVLNLYIETKDYFVVYGSAFNLMTLAEIIEFIKENIKVDYGSENYIMSLNKKLKDKRDYSHILKRVDLAIDIVKSIEEVVSNFRKLNCKGSKFYDDKGNIQTYYIGEKKNTLNKNILIRIYDKITDIKQKEKQFLYTDYLKKDFITRIEIEFRVEMLKFLRLEQLLDKSYIFSLFTTYISKHTKIFENIKGEDIKLIKLNQSITLDELYINQIVKNRYHNTFLGYCKKIYGLGGCPVHEMLTNGLISNLTIRDIGNAIDESGNFSLEKYKSGVSERYTKQLFANNVRKDE